MRFSVHEFYRENPGTTTAPFRLRDPATGKIIADVIGFDTETDRVSVICRGDDGKLIQRWDDEAKNHVLVAQDITMPFEIVDEYAGIEDEPTIKIHTVTMHDGKIVGEQVEAPRR